MYWVSILSNVSSLRGIGYQAEHKGQTPTHLPSSVSGTWTKAPCWLPSSLWSTDSTWFFSTTHTTLPLHLCRGVALPAFVPTWHQSSGFWLPTSPISQTSWNTEKAQMAAILDLRMCGGVSPKNESSCPRGLCTQSSHFKAGYQQKN